MRGTTVAAPTDSVHSDEFVYHWPNKYDFEYIRDEVEDFPVMLIERAPGLRLRRAVPVACGATHSGSPDPPHGLAASQSHGAVTADRC